MPVIQAITAAVLAAEYIDLRVSIVDNMPASMAKRTIIDRRDHT